MKDRVIALFLAVAIAVTAVTLFVCAKNWDIKYRRWWIGVDKLEQRIEKLEAQMDLIYKYIEKQEQESQ